jgi:hypothetical protein
MTRIGEKYWVDARSEVEERVLVAALERVLRGVSPVFITAGEDPNRTIMRVFGERPIRVDVGTMIVLRRAGGWKENKILWEEKNTRVWKFA